VKRNWLTKETQTAIKKRLMSSRKRNCYYCGIVLSRKTATIDHIVPLSKGGSFALDNLALCCKPCNQSKGNMDCVEFMAIQIKRDILEQKQAGDDIR
jgi:5-methylcytosine-specific restriction endonuclease McrA